MRPFGWMLAAVLALSPTHTEAAVKRAPSRTLPPLSQRVSQDSLQLVTGVSAKAFESVNASLIRDIADARRLRDDGALLRLLVLQGVGYALTGEPRRAAPVLGEAIPLAEGVQDTSLLLSALRWRAYTAGMLGDLDAQERFARRLVAVAAADSDTRFLAIGNHFMGWIARKRGDMARARQYLERAVEGQRALGAEGDEAFTRLAYGATLMDLGEYAAARRSYARLIALARKLRLDVMVAQAYNDLGVLERRAGDPGKAAEYLQRAYAVLRQRGETPESIGTLLNLATDELGLGRADHAAELAREGLEVCERRGFGSLRGSFLVMLASAEEAAGRPEASERSWQRVIALGDSVTPELRAMAIMGASRIHERAGRHAEALALVEAQGKALLPRLNHEYALRFRSGWASRLADVGRNAEAIAMLQPVFEEHDPSALAAQLRAWETLAETNMKLGRISQAKSAYDSACVAWELSRERSSDPEWRTSPWSAPGDLRLRSVAFLLQWPSSAPESERFALAYERLQRFRTRTLLEQTSGPGGSPGAAPQASIRSLRQVQDRLLGDGELLLEWAIGDDDALLFAITRTERRCFRLGNPDVLGSRLQIALTLLASAPGPGARSDATKDVALEAARLVFGPALPMVERAKSLVLVPDGPMHRVPFAALATRSGPLSAGLTLSIAPSVAVLAQARGRADALGKGMLVVAPAASEPSLPGARREAEWLVSAFEGVRRAEDATNGPERFAATLSGYDGLHFAGHASLDDRFPWRSGIDVGAGPETDPEGPAEPVKREASAAREFLRAETVASAHLSARLVVLASCETAAGRSVAGEGVSGLSTAFIAAGARTVVATLWRVDDRATEALMREFYRALAAGGSCAQALRTAQEKVRRNRATSHPHYWAGFVLIGDGRTTLPLNATPLWKRAFPAKTFGVRELPSGPAATAVLAEAL